MADNKTPDPSQQFQEWVSQWERSFDEFSNRLMGTEEFSKSMNQMQTMQMEFQRQFGELMARQLATFNMPSRDDVVALGEDIRNLDRRIAQIERALGTLLHNESDVITRKPGPARTRKPPSAGKDTAEDNKS